MVNHTTGSQRYNARMDKIWETAKRINREKPKEWNCQKVELGNNEWECESKRGTAVSMNANGAVRFTKFDCDKEVKVDGKTQKGKCGVEVY